MPDQAAGDILSGLVRLIKLRKQQPALDGNQLEVLDSGNRHVLCFVRHANGQRLLVLASFSWKTLCSPTFLSLLGVRVVPLC